jgi:hypothetical protein
MNAKLLIVFCVLSLGMIGCRNSTRTIDLPESRLVVGAPLQLFRGLTPLLAFSPNGRLAAALTSEGLDQLGQSEIEEFTLRLVVREVATGRTLFERATQWTKDEIPDGQLIPLVFDASGQHLYVFQAENEVGTLSRREMNSGQIEPVLPRREVNLQKLTNIEWGAGFRKVFLESREFEGGGHWSLDTTGKAELLGPGNLIFRPDGGVAVMTEEDLQSYDEEARNTLTHPNWRRGEMTLIRDKQSLKHLDAEAEVSTIWLRHDRALLPGREKGATGPAAAVLASDVDVLEFGFVPGQNAVYLQSRMETRVVPFEIVSLPSRTGSRP